MLSNRVIITFLLLRKKKLKICLSFPKIYLINLCLIKYMIFLKALFSFEFHITQISFFLSVLYRNPLYRKLKNNIRIRLV